MITNPGPALAYQDLYSLATELSVTRVSVANMPPLPLLLVSYAIEGYTLLVTRFPILAKLGLKELGYPISFLQPGVIKGTMHTLVDDSAIRRTVDEGGLGYRGACTSLEGMCEQLADWNREHEVK